MLIEIDGLSLELIKKNIKNLNLRIYPPDGLIKLSAPTQINSQFIRQYIQSKSDWILKQQERIRQHSANQQADKELQNGSNIPFKGNNYLLIINEHNGPKQIKITDTLIYCYTALQTSPTAIKMQIDCWYKNEMAILVPELIKKWEIIIKVKAGAWTIKKMKTRWGSCNTRTGRISLNLNLIKKPLPCLEYVIVHELVHLLERKHSQRFYALVTQFMPEWRQYQFLLEGKIRDKFG